ncbi:MAG: endo-1,4-beta-xylanase [Nibricoccus sp.]
MQIPGTKHAHSSRSDLRVIEQAHSRREFLAHVASTAALGHFGTVALSGVSASATPKNVVPERSATSEPIPYGAAVRADALADDAPYRRTIVSNCQLIVPEGEMKWADVRPSRAEFRFEKADAIVDFARSNDIKVRGHTLAWYGGMPAWTEEIASRAEAERELVAHIELIVGRYRGVIPSWDVVNEPIEDWPESGKVLRPSIWTKRLGPDYLPIALRAAAGADPSAQLVLNEYDIEFKGPRFAARRRALLQLLRGLRDSGAPLHAVGLQAHLFADRELDRDGLQALLSDVKAMGLDILVTELDVVDYELPGDVAERDALVAGTARKFLQTVFEVVRPKTISDLGIERSLHLGADLLQALRSNAELAASVRCRIQAEATLRCYRGIQAQCLSFQKDQIDWLYP